eukprot:COSAG05_NODE_745_length_7575_cov_3.254013_10_plen_45_part_00
MGPLDTAEAVPSCYSNMCRNLATSHARAGRGVEAKHWAFVSAFL